MTVFRVLFFIAVGVTCIVPPGAALTHRPATGGPAQRIQPLVLSATVSNPSLAEGDFGTSAMVFTLTRSSNPPGDQSAFSVNYLTEDGTAIAGTDYTLTAGTVQFAAGQTTATVSVPILGNRIVQTNRAFTLRVTNTNSAPGFLPQVTFPTGTSPVSVAGDDINGDGRTDVLVANRTDNTLSVRLNTTASGATTPTFSAQTTFATGFEPAAVTTADINGDGRPDVVVANNLITNQATYTVSVLLNTTPANAVTPSFSAQTTFTVGVQPTSVAAADFNGDNRPDIVTANAGADTLSIRLNTTAAGATTPTFSAVTTLANGIQPFSVTTADVNLDDRPDLLVSNIGSNNFTVRLNTTAANAAAPTFSSPVNFATGSLPVFITARDINGDINPDVLVASQNSDRLSVFTNLTPFNGTTPNFGTETSFPANGPSAVAVGDINGDGRPEVVTTSRFGNHVALFVNGTSSGDLIPTFDPATTFPTGNRPVALFLADINGDNRLDAVTANQDSNTVSVLLNNNNNDQGTSTTGIGTIVDDDTPTAVVAVAGTPQSAAVNTAFGTALTVEARNAAGNPVQGVFVTYTAPANGASGTFASPGIGTGFTGGTGPNGRLAAPIFTANATTGSYTVTARATSGGNPSASFSLTNTGAATGPTLTQFYPVASTTGRTITLTGTGFVPGNTQVFFGGARLIPATVLSGGTTTQIQVTVPASTSSANINGYLSVRVGATTIDSRTLPANAANPSLPGATFPEFVLWGDVNADGTFTGIDITLARAMFLGQVTAPTARQRLAIDVSPSNANGSRGDGNFAGIDITLLRALFLGQLAF